MKKSTRDLEEERCALRKTREELQEGVDLMNSAGKSLSAEVDRLRELVRKAAVIIWMKLAEPRARGRRQRVSAADELRGEVLRRKSARAVERRAQLANLLEGSTPWGEDGQARPEMERRLNRFLHREADARSARGDEEGAARARREMVPRFPLSDT